MLKRMFFLCWVTIFCYSCLLNNNKNTGKVLNPESRPGKDTHTLSNADSIHITHLDLNINVDMEMQQIKGVAVWTIENNNNLTDLKLDNNELTIDSTKVDNKIVLFKIDTVIPYLGKTIHIPIQNKTKQIAVYYKTNANAKALQWLLPIQTHDKIHSFLYTQSESIYARSWIPCPDGPGIRYTYDARVVVPNNLLALMSAENPQSKNDSGIYHFHMRNPIPAYLMALAVGDIVFEKIDDRTGVYAEPGMIEKCRHEFEDLGKMVSTAEQLYGPYRWGRYDVIVLPPCFPIGGMENPKLTFCTPTIIAGDKSLVSLIAHELAHSWSGNLVTNATWNDIWLNEGFTNYFERRIMEQMMGKDFSDMLWELGYKSLVDNVAELGPQSSATWLKQNLQGKDPDNGLSDVAYEKGSLLLKLIEINVGRDTFDKFLNQYFNEHAFTSMTSEKFLAYLDSILIKNNTELKNKLRIDEWVYGPGIPDNCPRNYPAKFKFVDEALKTYPKPITKEVSKNWSSHEWLHYLQKLNYSPNADNMKQLDEIYNFTNTGNYVLAETWFIMAIRASYKPAFGAMDHFLSEVGRQYMLEEIYGEMLKSPTFRELGHSIYSKYRKNYHPLTQAKLDKLMAKY